MRDLGIKKWYLGGRRNAGQGSGAPLRATLAHFANLAAAEHGCFAPSYTLDFDYVMLSQIFSSPSATPD